MLLESVTRKVLGAALGICINTFCFVQNAEITAFWLHSRAAVQEKLISLQTREKQLAIHAYSNCVYLPSNT